MNCAVERAGCINQTDISGDSSHVWRYGGTFSRGFRRKERKRALSRFADRKSIFEFFKINCTSWDESFVRGEYTQPGNYSNCIATRLNVPLDCSLSLSLSLLWLRLTRFRVGERERFHYLKGDFLASVLYNQARKKINAPPQSIFDLASEARLINLVLNASNEPSTKTRLNRRFECASTSEKHWKEREKEEGRKEPLFLSQFSKRSRKGSIFLLWEEQLLFTISPDESIKSREKIQFPSPPLFSTRPSFPPFRSDYSSSRRRTPRNQGFRFRQVFGGVVSSIWWKEKRRRKGARLMAEGKTEELLRGGRF